MRLASYQLGGRQSFGIVTDAGIVDIPRRIEEASDLKAGLELPAGLGQIRRFIDDPPDHAIREIAFLPAIPRPDKIICIGLNYRAHIEEVSASPPEHPPIFFRVANAQVGHLNPLIRPRASTRYDYEGELAVIIGRPARHVRRADALGYVAGYTCFNDGSVRDWQRHSHQYGPGKNFFHSGAMGPWMTTADEIPDPAALAVTTRLNGNVVQNGSTGDMIFDVPALIEYISTFTQLRPGDVIVTGTPSGVGFTRRPPLYMQAGDVVEVEISGIGTLRNPVADEG